MSASDAGGSVYVAEVELLLTEELRSLSAADIRIGRIGVQAMQVDHISVDVDAHARRANARRSR